MPTIRVSQETYDQLQLYTAQLAVKRGSIDGLNLGVAIQSLLQENGVSPPNPTTASSSVSSLSASPPNSTVPTRPQSSVPEVQDLIDGLLNGVESNLGPITLASTASGRWVSQPKNFFTIKVQDARNQDVVVTVYGEPQKFSSLNVSINIARDRPSYSRFNLKNRQQIPEAVDIICASDALR